MWVCVGNQARVSRMWSTDGGYGTGLAHDDTDRGPVAQLRPTGREPKDGPIGPTENRWTDGESMDRRRA